MTLSRTTLALGLLALGLLAGIVALTGPAASDGVAAKKKRIKPKTVLVSRRSAKQGGAAGNATSEFPKVSASGRYVAFTSQATNLGGGPTSDNAYLYDRKRKRLRFIARANGPGRAAANDDSRVEALSANGRFVAFSTAATNLGGPITPGVLNVYLYDRKRGRIELVSRASRSGPGGDGHSFDASISGGGRYVAFASDADNFGGPIDTGVLNVYVYDRKRKRVRLVSRAGGSGPGGDDDSARPSISAGGRQVAFETEADNLGGPLDIGVQNIYVYDLERRRVALVSRRSRAAGGGGGDAESRGASISGGGRFVAFRSDADNLGGPAADVPNIYVYDRKRRRVQLVSRRSGKLGAGADAVSYTPAVSGDGRFIAFDTEATNLGGGATALQNVYVYDRRRKRVELASRRTGRRGPAADQNSLNPDLSPSGRFVAFTSQANNLSPAAPGFPFSSAYLRDRGR